MIGKVFMYLLEKICNLNSAKKRALLDNQFNKIKVNNSKPEIYKKYFPKGYSVNYKILGQNKL